MAKKEYINKDGKINWQKFVLLAVNPPLMKAPSIYKIEVNSYIKGSHYPTVTLLKEMESYHPDYRKALYALQKYIAEYHVEGYGIHSAYIHRIRLGINCIPIPYDHSWLFDDEGKLLAETCYDHVTNPDVPLFYGRTSESVPFHSGDIVELINNEEAVLGIIVHEPPTVEKAWSIYQHAAEKYGEEISKLITYYNPLDDSDDSYYAFDVINDSPDDHVHQPFLSVSKPHLAVPTDLRERLLRRYREHIEKYHR